jgi:hypothetical protein
MKGLLLIFTLCIPTFVFAQSSMFYQFKKEMATYVELTADTPVLPAKFGEGELTAFELKGETFSIFGKNYVMNDSSILFMFSSNGYIRIDDDTSHVILDGLLHFLDSIDGNSKFSYKIEGSGNNKVLKVQWKNLKIRDGAAGNYVNFQIWYYKANGIMETHYGPCSANNRTGYTRLTGPNVGLFHSPKDFSRMLEKIWVTKYADSFTLDTSRTVVFNTMFGVPENGTVYRYVPKHVATGVGNKSSLKISLTPNPADKEVVLTFEKALTEAVEVSLADIQGRRVYHERFLMGSERVRIPVRAMSPGSYYLNVTGTSIQHRQQLTIRH